MGWFGSIERLRGATAAEIAEVEGFGPKLASDLQRFLAHGKAPPPEIP
jgi:ERCC4-type nuclease